MQIAKFTETRTVTGITVTPTSHVFFDGPGVGRVLHNDGQLQVLNARRNPGNISGRMHGTTKVVRIAQAQDWYSLRSIGKGGGKGTVYVKGGTLLVVDGKEYTVRDFYSNNA